MATEVTPDGKVVAPLNITAPTPSIDLKGFQWDSVDKKIHPPETGLRDLPKQLAEQLLLHDDRKPPHFPLEHFDKAYAGNGFNLIFRPRANGYDELPCRPGDNCGPDDNILELNLTTEQLTFGGSIGDIPNRGLRRERDIHLTGLPYLQTVQDVTYPRTGKGNHPDKTCIHFEPGVWLYVPAASFHNEKPSIVRMASIPHGTTINAQGFAPHYVKGSNIGGSFGGPKIPQANSTPFDIGNPGSTKDDIFVSMNEDNNEDFRIPQNLKQFGASGSKKITTAVIKDPNLVLKKAIEGLEIEETITFEVSTDPRKSGLNGGGTANISFLAGKQDPITTTDMVNPTAFAPSMTATYWIERVLYTVVVPGDMLPNTSIDLRAIMPAESTAPTPVFRVTTGPSGNKTEQTIKIPGTQIQYSQNVILNFSLLSWPHISVSTLVPTDPQPFTMS